MAKDRIEKNQSTWIQLGKTRLLKKGKQKPFFPVSLSTLPSSFFFFWGGVGGGEGFTSESKSTEQKWCVYMQLMFCENRINSSSKTVIIIQTIFQEFTNIKIKIKCNPGTESHALSSIIPSPQTPRQLISMQPIFGRLNRIKFLPCKERDYKFMWKQVFGRNVCRTLERGEILTYSPHHNAPQMSRNGVGFGSSFSTAMYSAASDKFLNLSRPQFENGNNGNSYIVEEFCALKGTIHEKNVFHSMRYTILSWNQQRYFVH